MRIVNAVVAAALSLAALLGDVQFTHVGDASIRRQDQRQVVEVYCPTEDSCELTYDGELDRWIVTRKPAGSW